MLLNINIESYPKLLIGNKLQSTCNEISTLNVILTQAFEWKLNVCNSINMQINLDIESYSFSKQLIDVELVSM